MDHTRVVNVRWLVCSQEGTKGTSHPFRYSSRLAVSHLPSFLSPANDVCLIFVLKEPMVPLNRYQQLHAPPRDDDGMKNLAKVRIFSGVSEHES